MKFAILLGVLGLTACGAQSAATIETNTVAGAGVALTEADGVVLNYVTLPLCAPGTTRNADGTLCSQAAVSTIIKADAQTAHDDYKKLEAGLATLQQVQADITNLTSAVPK